MITFLLFTPASKRWLGWRKTENARRDRLGWFCYSCCTVILRYSLRYVLSVTFCGAAVLKVMDQKTLVKRRWSYKGAYNCVCINTWTVCQTRVYHLQIFDWKQFARHSFSILGGVRLSLQTSKTNESTVSLSPAERWTITEIRRQLNSILTCSLLTDVLL